MKPLPPLLKSSLASACHTLGLALAIYLALLKIYALPCMGPGHCQEILYSKYGSVLGVPVGIFGAFLWIGIIAVRNKDKRDLLLLMLALGTAYFMFVQFLVLRGFCLYCTLHAATAWGALFFHNEKRRIWTPFLAAAIAAGGFLLVRSHADSSASSPTAQMGRLIQLPDNVSALPWLGPIHPRSPALVLSLDCAACLDVLERLNQGGFKNRSAGPAVFFKVNDANRTLTREFLAAVLAQGELARRDAFLATVTVLLMDKEKALGDPAAAAERLAAMFPNAEDRKADAEIIIAAQNKALVAASVGTTTPLLITRDGQAHALFETAALFP